MISAEESSAPVTDGESVYFTNPDDGTIYKVSVDGGSASPIWGPLGAFVKLVLFTDDASLYSFQGFELVRTTPK